MSVICKVFQAVYMTFTFPQGIKHFAGKSITANLFFQATSDPGARIDRITSGSSPT